MYVTPNIYDVEQHQEQLKNNMSIAYRQLAWHNALALQKQNFLQWQAHVHTTRLAV